MRVGRTKVSPSVAKEVKGMLKHHSQRRVASMTSLSQYVIWCIANNQYEEKEKEQEIPSEGMFSWENYRKKGII